MSNTLTKPGSRSAGDGGRTGGLADLQLPVVPSETYLLEREVGKGGIGRILAARDRTLGRTVAIKELLRDSASEVRFIREALVTARLEHPNIVPVYEAGRWPSGEPFYTMKLVSGRPLSEVIKASGSFTERLALLPAAIAVADAIGYAHSKRVIHRDIKPHNVIVGDFGETVVIDWGLAKDLNARDGDDVPIERAAVGSADATTLGDVMGTPAYMPPEQARGEVVDERADVYSIGALLYHLLAGVAPYAPTEAATIPSPTQVIADVVLRPPVPLEQREPAVPVELCTLVLKAMARDPADRYPTAKELADDLKRYQTGQLVRAHRYSTQRLTSCQVL
jgi:serine/threonine protein kinase